MRRTVFLAIPALLLGVGYALLAVALVAVAPRQPRRTARGRTLAAPPRPDDEALASALDGVLALYERRHVRRSGLDLIALGLVAMVVLTFTVGYALLGVVLVAVAPRLPRRTARGRTLAAPPRPDDDTLAAALDGVLALSERRRALEPDGVFA
ncbi:MAG TPA: hypothetical protein VGH57_08790 [Amycolatopsis sp.]